jgi:outer membrane protein TolC
MQPQQGPIAEATAERAVQAARFERLQAEVIGAARRARSAYLSAVATLQDARRLQEDVDAREAQMRRQFELGHTDRLAYLHTRLETLAAREAVEDLLVEAQDALGRLEDAAGRPLDGTPPIDALVHTDAESGVPPSPEDL